MPEPRDDAPRAARSRTESERTTRHRRDRRTQLAVVAIAAIVGIVAGALGTNRNGTARAGAVEPTTTTAPPPSPAQTLLLAHVNARGAVDLLALMGVRRGGRAGAVVFVPTATLVQVPAFDSQRVSDVYRLGGSGLLATSVANALDVGVNRVIVLTDAQLTDLLTPAGRMDVDLENPVQVNDAAGNLGFTAGRAHLGAADAIRLVIGPTTGGGLAHLAVVQDVFEGWFARLRDPAVARATAKVRSAAWSLVALAHSKVRFDTAPVTTLTSGSATIYELEDHDTARLVRADLPDALITTAHRPRVEILNGTGAIALTQQVARLVVPAGGEVTLTGNVPGFGVKHTTVVYYRPDALAAAKRVAAALGVGSVALGNVPLDVVDVTVVAGADFHPERH
jgi:hypothetical protein